MAPDLSGYPPVWIWWLGNWRFCQPHFAQYPDDPKAVTSFWCYEDPTGVHDIDEETDYDAEWDYVEIQTNISYHSKK